MTRSSRDPDIPAPTGRKSSRHTLGSNPESHEPTDYTVLPTLPGNGADAGEPLHTIYVGSWSDARERANQLDPPLRAMFIGVLDQVEAGWTHVRALQRWYEDHREQALERSDDYAHLLLFIDGDLVDLFRELAAGVAALVPGYAEWEAEADPEGVEGELDRFIRYFVVFRHAAEAIDAPGEFRNTVHSAAQGLAGWPTELAVLIAAIDEAVVVPPYDSRRAASR